jgi:FkbM family methyltransferase
MGLNNSTSHLSGENSFLQSVFATPSSHPRVVLDVGANVGSYANHIKKLDSEAIVYAFEPHPANFEHLVQAASLHDYEALNVGVSDTAGHMHLFDHARPSQKTVMATFQSGVLEQWNLRKGIQQDIVQWETPVITIDEFVTQRGITHIHLLKIDTEGHEMSVLRGAQQVINSNCIDMIQFEINWMNTISRTFFKDFYDMLPMYTFYRFLPSAVVPLGSYDPILLELFSFQNILAVHHDRKAYIQTQYRLV